MKNIVIVGGGTAGWLTALYANKNFPNDNITLIESDEIGILGAGEGTSTNFIDFIKYLDLDFTRLIKQTNATLKVGIKFTNWSNNNKYYYHGFGSKHNQDFGNYKHFIPEEQDIFLSDYTFPNALISEIDFNNTTDSENVFFKDLLEEDNFFQTMSEQNKVLFSVNESKIQGNGLMKKLNQYYRYALHFDARELAKFLSAVGASRGINRIEGKIVSLNSLENNDIESLVLESGQVLDSDFIFDCSGFSRLIIGKHFKSEWISFKDQLPMKKAIPFFIEIDKENIPPYTESIAMNYGWMWKIPLQHRYGCGYVFDSDYITQEEAVIEIEKFLGFEPKYPKENKGSFDFNPGCFNDVLINNVLCVGLSSGFIEPLEATSITQSIILLTRFFSNPALLLKRNQSVVDIFNKKYVEDSRYVVDFVQLHYFTNKTNTKFWSEFIEKNKISESLKHKMLLMNESVLLNEDTITMFAPDSYYAVANGLNLLNKENIKNHYKSLGFDQFIPKIKNKKNIKEGLEKSFLSHKDFLKYVGDLND
jgi:tryptophan halogenase